MGYQNVNDASIDSTRSAVENLAETDELLVFASRAETGESSELTSPACAQIIGSRVSLAAGGSIGGAAAPSIVNGKIRRPAWTVHAGCAAGIGQAAAHLVERCLRILPAESRIGRRGRVHLHNNACRERQRDPDPKGFPHVLPP